MNLSSKAAVLATFVTSAAFGQSTAALAFEVASIRVAANTGFIGNRTPSLKVDPGRNVNFINTSLRELMMLAFGVGVPQIVGPDWLMTERFDIVARVPADATQEQVPAMLRTLLAERFKLVLHHEQKMMQIYALELGKGQPKLRETTAGATGGCNRSFAQSTGIALVAVCQKMSSADLAQQVQTLAPAYFGDKPVVDLTGLKGVYDFQLEWISLADANAGKAGSTMIDAVEKQLGLRLEQRKQAMDTLVIDHCEREPTAN